MIDMPIACASAFFQFNNIVSIVRR
jgi:hypothetical protein